MMIGYKVMAHSKDKKEIFSLANNNLIYSVNEDILRMPENGIYLALSKKFVIDYYSGLHEHEVLVTFEFDELKIITGNVTDNESVVTVRQAKIIDLEFL